MTIALYNCEIGWKPLLDGSPPVGSTSRSRLHRSIGGPQDEGLPLEYFRGRGALGLGVGQYAARHTPLFAGGSAVLVESGRAEKLGGQPALICIMARSKRPQVRQVIEWQHRNQAQATSRRRAAR